MDAANRNYCTACPVSATVVRCNGQGASAVSTSADTSPATTSADSSPCRSSSAPLLQKHQFRATAGATTCLLCPRGTQTQDTGNIDCTDCAVGYYNGVEGEQQGEADRSCM
jgi:hypothetical protein